MRFIEVQRVDYEMFSNDRPEEPSAKGQNSEFSRSQFGDG
jgi:hypothetical protein